jgi:2-polyprenyl-3-methyl-5-hydroxy-6-metoxy-1,4-benzoquinol methylase
MKLLDLYKSTDNKSDKELYHQYISHFYDEKFEKFKDKEISILEIGIQYGNSLKLWDEYFTNGKIYAIDIKEYYIHSYSSKVNTIIGNAYSHQIISFFKDRGILFDIIIDDGPHTVQTQDFFLQNYPSLLKPNQSMIILEDIYTNNFAFLRDKYSDYSVVDLTSKIGGEMNSRILYKEYP